MTTCRIIREGKPDWNADVVAEWRIGKDQFAVVASETLDNRYSLWINRVDAAQQDIPAGEMMRVIAAWASRPKA